MSERLEKSIPLLRGDLRFILQSGKDREYILEDPLRQKFYRIGSVEYLFLTQLDGSATLAEITDQTNALLTTFKLEPEDADVIVKWLFHNQLLSVSAENDTVERKATLVSEKRRELYNKFNLLTIKVPLFNPDSLFQKLRPWLSWVVGPVTALVWGLVCAYSLLVFLHHSGPFFSTVTAAFSPANLFFLWLAWFGLKIAHELGHGLACYRYGGRVYEAGVLFVAFFPLTYINGSSSLRFPSRWQRIHAAFAGIYIELFIAAVALLVWVDNPGTIVGNMAHNIVIVAGFSSLIFNLNPLMRFDGYFILSDLLGIPNLYSRGKEFVHAVVDYILFGQWRYLRRMSFTQEMIIAVYGMCAWIWRVVVLTLLLLLVAGMFKGFGIFIAVTSVLLLIGIPAYRTAGRFAEFYQKRGFKWYRPVVALVSIILIGAVVLFGFHFNPPVKVAAVVQYENEILVKSDVSGMVEQVYVANGDFVEQGAPLVRLHNPELILALNQLEIELQVLQAKKRNSLLSESMPQYQVLEKEVAVVAKQVAALEEDVDSLVVKAPAAGTVIAKNLQERVGTYLASGREIAWLVDEKKKKLLAAVEEEGAYGFRGKNGRELTVIKHSLSSPSFSAEVKSIAPNATKTIPHQALSAAAGGPVAVRYNPSQKNEVKAGGNLKSSSSVDGYEFFRPRFRVEISLDSKMAENFLAGQVVTVTSKGGSLTLFQLLRNYLARYFTEKLAAAE